MTTPQPLKILHLISGDLWAGAEAQALTLMCALKKMPEIEVAAVLMNEGELAKRLREQHIPVTVFPENTLGAFVIFKKLRQLMLSWKPDIVHTHRIKENILGSIANYLSIHARSVRTVHGANEHPPKGIRNIHKHALNFLNVWTGNHLQQSIIAVSHELGQKLRDEFNPSKIVVIENGIDIEAIRSQANPATIRMNKESAKHIGIVGRLAPVKRVDLFIEMAARLKTDQPQTEWHFHVFGDGPLKNQLIAQSKLLKIDDLITFHGHRNDIIACIAALDVLVMCSDHEGMPMTILESIAVNGKIVAHDVGGISSAIKNYSRGILVRNQDSSSYAHAVSAILNRVRFEISQELLNQISSKTNAHRMLRCYQLISKKNHC